MSVPVFDTVTVTVGPEGSKLVEWRLNPYAYRTGAALQFYVETARPGGEWTRLNPDEPLTDVCYYTDTTRYRWGVANDFYYRVVAVDGTTEHASQPASAMGALSRHDRLIAKEILRQEYVRMRAGAGIAGYLLLRREHGDACPECLDFDTEDPVNSLCSYCYGTGVRYGYYNAYYPYYVSRMQGPRSAKDVKEPHATEDIKGWTARALAYPRLEPYSVWVEGTTNRRFIIRTVAVAAAVGSTPLVYTLGMLQEATTSIVYQVPMEQTTPDGPEEDEANGWRIGISDLEDV